MARFIRAVVFSTLILGIAIAYPLITHWEELVGADWQAWYFLPGLVGIPFVWWWSIFAQDARRPKLRVGTIAPILAGPRGFRAKLRDLPGMLRAVALVMMILALGRPVTVLHDQKSDDKGIDIVLVMDLSGSMRAVLDAEARDLPGNPQLPRNKRLTRLDVAKIVVKDFISRRRTDRMGVVVFGKSAYILSPPTLDYHLLTQLVSKMSLSVIDGSGTAIGDGVGTAVARMRRSDAQSKVILLLTDGDSNAGAIAPDYAAHLATTINCKVYTIQIGTGDEVDVEDGYDLLGQPKYSRQRFPVNPELLQRIAKTTGGESYIATDAKALADSMHAVLDQLEKTRFEASNRSFRDLFPVLLVPGVLLIAIEALLRAVLLRRFP